MRRAALPIFLLFFLFALHDLRAQKPLTELPEFENAKVIAVGESAHRVPAFAKYRAELFKEFVHRGMTKTLLVETNYSAATIINEYIWGDSSSEPDSIINKGLYGIYAGSEMADLIQWMRDYNQDKSAPGKLSIKGIDAQSAKVATGIVETFLRGKDPDFETTIPLNGLALLKELGASRNYNIKRLPKEEQEKIEKTVLALRALVNKHGGSHPTIHLHQRVIEQTLAFEKANPINFTNIRDANMAELVLEHLKHEEKPVFLWAHNGHVAKSKSSWYKPLGHHLNKLLTVEYLAVGLDFREGEIRNTYRAGTSKFEPLKDPDWIGSNINQPVDEPILINMKGFKNVTIRDIGAGNGTYKTKSNKSFDYLVYFKRVSPN